MWYRPPAPSTTQSAVRGYLLRAVSGTVDSTARDAPQLGILRRDDPCAHHPCGGPAFVAADDAPDVAAYLASGPLQARTPGGPVTAPIIEIRDMSKKYDLGRPALAGLNLDVR